jgi:zinc protease
MFGNGVTVIVAENRFSPTVTIRASVKAGSMRESDGESGLAGLTARMLERGTTSRNVFQLAEGFDFLGAHVSIDAGYLLARFTVHGLSKDTPVFLQLLGEMLQAPEFSPAEFELVRSEVLSQLRELSQHPRWIADQALRERIYPEGHPFRRMAQGSRATVERLKLGDLIAFYKRYYRPDQLILSVAGDVASDSVFESCDKYFGRWTGSGNPDPFAISAVAPGFGAGNHWIDSTSGALSQIAFGVAGPSIRHPDYYPLLILNHIFGRSGRGGRLAAQIRDKEGSVVAIESRFDANLAEGPFVIGATVAPASVDRTVELIRRQAGDIRDSGVSAGEVTSAKKALIRAWAVQLGSNEGLARQLEALELYQLGEDYLQRFPEMIAGVSQDGLLDCSRTRFSFERAALVVVRPLRKE